MDQKSISKKASAVTPMTLMGYQETGSERPLSMFNHQSEVGNKPSTNSTQRNTSRKSGLPKIGQGLGQVPMMKP